tara:strand:- start:102 stop:728 length:627 start_codon:yes stop_codon:yes gene_type:complete
MEKFNENILKLLDNINDSKKEKNDAKKLINNYIIEKQFLAYYLYRIWIKYRKLVENVNTKTEFIKVLKYLEIPVKYHNMNVTYPLCNKMVNNEKQLDLVILTILKHLNKIEKVFGGKKSSNTTGNKSNKNADGAQKEKQNNKPKESKEIKSKNKDYDNFMELINYKELSNIIEDIVQLKMFVPNLSKPSTRINIWETYNPLVKSFSSD